MSRIVLDPRSPSTVAATSAAAAGSRWTVGSSSTSREASRSSALASPSCWRCPADSPWPPARPPFRSRPGGAARTGRRRPGGPPSIAAWPAPGRPRARFAATVPGTIAGCWDAHAHRSRQRSRSASAAAAPGDHDPLVGSGEPEQHPPKGGLPGPADPDHGHQLARLELQVDPVQRRHRPPGVGTVTPRRPTGPAAGSGTWRSATAREGARAGPVEGVEDPLGAGQAVGAGVEQGGHRPHGAYSSGTSSSTVRAGAGRCCRRPGGREASPRARSTGSRRGRGPPGEERQAQRAHGGAPVAVGDLADPGDWAVPRLKARSVGRPRTTSRNQPESPTRACQLARARRRRGR